MNQDFLDVGVHQPLSPEARVQLLNEHLRQKVGLQDVNASNSPFQAYFLQYERQCVQLSINDLGKLRHRHLARAVDLALSSTRHHAVESLGVEAGNLPNGPPPDAQVFAQDWLCFAARTILLIDICEWEQDIHWEDFLMRTFAQSTLKVERLRLPHSFHVRSLEKICGMKVRWTDVLSNHLLLENDDSRICIFHQNHIMDCFAAV